MRVLRHKFNWMACDNISKSDSIQWFFDEYHLIDPDFKTNNGVVITTINPIKDAEPYYRKIERSGRSRNKF